MIEKLKKGMNLEYGSSNLPSSGYSFDYVELDGKVVGVGYFDNDNEGCISAIIKNAKGEKLVLEELTSDHPLDKIVKNNLEDSYKRHFEN